MVMELMETSLFMALHEGKIPTFSRRRSLLKGVASAMEFLHTRGIVHRDIKSMNILLSRGNDENEAFSVAKLADFGEAKEKGFATTHAMTMSMSTSSGPGAAGGVSGTVAYQAPEVLLQQVTEASRKAEIHTFGIVVWECLTGEIPHQGKGPIQLILMAQDKSKETMLDIPQASPGFRDPDWNTLRSVANACMLRVAGDRPSASQVVAAMDEGPSYSFDNANTKPPRRLQTVECDLCHVEGDRVSHYKCATCPNFDLCKSCHSTAFHGHHDFYRYNMDALDYPIVLPALDPPSPVPVPSVNAVAKPPFLTIERRCKEKQAPVWEIYRNGTKVADLSNNDRLRLGSIKKGDKFGVEAKGGHHYELVVKKVPADLKIGLKPIESGWISAVHYTGRNNGIAVCNSDNFDHYQGHIQWLGRRTSSQGPSKLATNSSTSSSTASTLTKITIVPPKVALFSATATPAPAAKPVHSIKPVFATNKTPQHMTVIPAAAPLPVKATRPKSHIPTPVEKPLILTPAPVVWDNDDDGYDC